MKAKRSEKLFRSFDVWKRIQSPKGVQRYRCFEDLASRKFCVQSSDFYRNPVTLQAVSELEKQFIELLIEQSPFERSGGFSSIEAAIEDHDRIIEE
jgi:hypothetical protein